MNIAAYPKYETYKPTGVAWSPEAPDHWNIKPVAAVARVTSVANQPDLELLSVYLGRGLIRFSDVEEKRTNATSLDLSKYQVVRPGNLVLNNQQAWRGSVGVSEHTGIVSPAYIVLDLGDAFDGRFADYYFQTSTTVSHFLVSSKGVGTIQRNLYWPALRRCPITIPPLPEQRAIATFLDIKCAKIDDAVRIKEAQIKLLRERRQILIQQAVTRGLSPDVPMKDSGIDWIGEIPAHWEVKPCRYVFRTVRRSDRNGSEVKLSVTQRRGIVPTDQMEENSTQAKDFDAFQLCHPDDLVLNKYKAHLGVFWRAPMHGIITNNYTVFQPLSGIISKYFEVLFHTPIYITLFRSTVYGVTEGMAPLYTSDFYGLPAICPPEKEQRNIIQYLSAESAKFDRAISIKESQIAALKEYKTTLINAAVTGKIKVS